MLSKMVSFDKYCDRTWVPMAVFGHRVDVRQVTTPTGQWVYDEVIVISFDNHPGGVVSYFGPVRNVRIETER